MSAPAVDQGAPLMAHEGHPGCRVKLYCRACGWDRTYDPARIIEGLRQRKLGDRQTAVGAVAHHVRWPCPRCRRMRWGSLLITP